MPYMRSALASFPGPRPASRRLQYAYCKRREAGRAYCKRVASSACCERLPEQQAGSLQASYFTNPQHYCTAGNKTGSKSPIKCVVANALLL